MRASLHLLISLLLLTSSINAWAWGTQLNNQQAVYKLGLQSEIYFDTSMQLQIQDLLTTGHNTDFQTYNDEVVQAVLDDANVWLHFKVYNDSPQLDDQTWYLNDLDSAHIYLVQNQKLIRTFDINDNKLSSFPIEHYTPLLPIRVKYQEPLDIYVLFAPRDGFIVKAIPHLNSTKYTLQDLTNQNLFLGCVVGGIIALMIYNLIVYLFIREKIYLYYLALLASNTLIIIAISKLGFRFFWPEAPQYSWFATMLGAYLGLSMGCLFVIEFLKLYKRSRRLYRIFQAAVYVGFAACIALMIFPPNDILNRGIDIIGPPYLLLALVTAVRMHYQGIVEAKYYLLGCSLPQIFLIYYLLMDLSLVRYSMWADSTIYLSYLSSAILMSFALGARLSIIQDHNTLLSREKLLAERRSNVLKSQFLTTVSHELRTPMNAIVGGLELSERNDAEGVKFALSGAKDMIALIDDILLYTELQAQKKSINKTSFNSVEFFKQLRTLYQPLFNAKGVDFIWSEQGFEQQGLSTDHEKFRVCCDKLLDNALKFTEHGEVKVNVSYQTEVQQLEFSVDDSGIGLSQQQVDIFETFAQLDTGLQRKRGGIGIGLSLVKQLMYILKGSINVESNENGSCFTLTIPAKLCELDEPEKQDTSDQPVVKNGKNLPILVVEDNVVNQKVLCKLLQKSGYQSLVANHGEEALSVLEKHTVSLILMDLQMPIMDGFSCSQALRARDDYLAHIPIIAVSANLMEEDIKRCDECGINGYIHKPIRIAQVDDLVGKYIGSGNSDQPPRS